MSTPSPTPPRSNFTMKPAAVVGIIAVVLVAVFTVGSLLYKQPSPSSGPKLSSKPVAGTPFVAIAGRKLLRPIEVGDQPPVNVVAAVALPKGSMLKSVTNNSAAAGQYDEQVELSISGSEEQLVTFFTTEMPKLGWKIESTGAPRNQPGVQVLGQIGGDDGWYWEMGAIVSPSTFGASGQADSTRFTVRLLQEPDAT